MLTSARREIRIGIRICMLDGDEEQFLGSLFGVRDGLFQVSAPVYLRTGRRLVMVHPDAPLEGHVADCIRSAAGGYELGVILAADFERRAEQRVPVSLPAMLFAARSAMGIPVTVTDASASGVGLRVPREIPAGTRVRIEWAHGSAVGQVRHCAAVENAYRAGVMLDALGVRPAGISLAQGEGVAHGEAASFSRTLEQRQARYEAILYSLAPAKDARDQ